MTRTEEQWVKDYERKQGAALGDAKFQLPSHEELYEEHRKRDRKRREEKS